MNIGNHRNIPLSSARFNRAVESRACKRVYALGTHLVYRAIRGISDTKPRVWVLERSPFDQGILE